MTPFYKLLLGILCVWRVTHFFYVEDGPWDVVFKIRKRVGEGFWGKLMDCFCCLSFWIALLFALILGTGWLEIVLLWFGLSAGAILLEQMVFKDLGVPPALYFEEQKPQDKRIEQ
jgi:hypothetical protein